MAAEQSAMTAPGGGHGLVGMRERVSLLDGRVHSASTADGGYRVEVALPLDEESVEGASLLEGESADGLGSGDGEGVG
jgi:signal transduction histidine kinase